MVELLVVAMVEVAVVATVAAAAMVEVVVGGMEVVDTVAVAAMEVVDTVEVAVAGMGEAVDLVEVEGVAMEAAGTTGISRCLSRPRPPRATVHLSVPHRASVLRQRQPQGTVPRQPTQVSQASVG